MLSICGVFKFSRDGTHSCYGILSGPRSLSPHVLVVKKMLLVKNIFSQSVSQSICQSVSQSVSQPASPVVSVFYCWPDVSVRKVLRPAISIQVFLLGFPVSSKQMLRWFPSFQADTTCFSCSPPDKILDASKSLVYVSLSILVYVFLKPLPPGETPIAVE